jgi:histone H3/H4
MFMRHRPAFFYFINRWHGLLIDVLRFSRLARRGGVKRISAMVYEEVRAALKCRLEMV